MNAYKIRHYEELGEKQKIIESKDVQLRMSSERQRELQKSYDALLMQIEEQQRIIEKKDQEIAKVEAYNDARLNNYGELLKKIEEQQRVIDGHDQQFVRIVGEQMVKIVGEQQRIIDNQTRELAALAENGKAQAANYQELAKKIEKSSSDNIYYSQLQLCFAAIAIAVSYVIFGFATSPQQDIFIISGIFILVLSVAVTLFFSYVNKNRTGRWI